MLLDDYEKGMTAARLDEIFTEVCYPITERRSIMTFAAARSTASQSQMPALLELCAMCLRPQVRGGLVPLIAALKTNGRKPDDAWLAGDYDVKEQAKLCEEVALDMGESAVVVTEGWIDCIG